MHQSQSIPQPDSQHSDIFHTFSIQPLYRTEHLQFNFTYKTFTVRCNRDIFPDSYCTIYLCALSCSHIFSFLTSHRWNRDAFIFKSDDIFENCIFQEQFSTYQPTFVYDRDPSKKNTDYSNQIVHLQQFPCVA